MKVTLVKSMNGWVALYLGDSLLDAGYLDSGDILKLLIDKGSILNVEEHFISPLLFKIPPYTLTEFYKIKEGLC